MASVYTNDLRLEEIGSGEQSGTWGDTTNTNLELIAEAFSFGTEAITTNADTHTTTIADGASDPGRSLFLKYTGTLDSACTITIAPNTVSKLWFIENGTSGSQNIIISQGSGANITIPPGDTKAIYSDGAGSGAAMVDAFASLSVVDLKVQDDLTVTDDAAIGGTLGVTGIATFTDDIIIGDGKTIGSASDVDAITIAANGQVTLTQTLIGTALDISGDIDVDGTTNLDVVDIDGAVNMATTALVTGVLTTTAATVFNGGFASNANSTIGGTVTITSNTPVLTFIESDQSNQQYQIGSFGSAFAINDGTNSQFRYVIDTAGNHTFNEGGADCNFRVESDNHDNIFFIDGGHDGIGIGNSTIIDWSTNYPGLQMGQAGVLYGHKSSNQMIFGMNWGVTTGNVFIADGIASRMFMDTTKIAFDSSASGSAAGAITGIPLFNMTPAAGSHFNSDRGGVIDFRISSGSKTHMFVVDSGSDYIAMGTGDQNNGGLLNLNAVSGSTVSTMTTRSATDAHTNIFTMLKTPATSGNYTATGSGDILGEIRFMGVNTSTVADIGAMIQVEQTGTASGTVPAQMSFLTNEATAMIITKDGVVQIPAKNNAFNFQAFASNTSSFFGIREDANDSVLVQIDRSDGNTGFLYNGHTLALTIGGALSKGSGSFKIDHPLEAKKDTHHLVHSFIEGPQADLIYRGKVALSSGSATVNIDTVAGMTEGTFVALNTDVQCFTSNETGWTATKGSVSGNILTITAQDNSCTETISWLVIGERHDPHMKDELTEWTDIDGKVIVEPAKS